MSPPHSPGKGGWWDRTRCCWPVLGHNTYKLATISLVGPRGPGAIVPPGVQGPASTRCGSEITAAPQRVCSTHPGCSKWLADTRNGVCVNYTWDNGIYARVMRGGGKESVCG